MNRTNVLPALVRLDLNPDGSVTLFLTRPGQKLARIAFGACATEHLYRVTRLSAAIATEDEAETLDFMMVDHEGTPSLIEARVDDAALKFNQIFEHLKQHASTSVSTN